MSSQGLSRPAQTLIGMGVCLAWVLYQRRQASPETPEEKKAEKHSAVPEPAVEEALSSQATTNEVDKKASREDKFFGKQINKPFKDILNKIIKVYGLRKQSLSHGYITKLTLPSTGQVEYLMGACVPFNSHVAAALCKDKAATCEILRAHDVPHIPCKLVSRKGIKTSDPRCGTWTVLLNMLKESQPGGLVLKPTKGGGGLSVFHCTSERELELAWRELPALSFVVSAFQPIHTEIRVFVLHGKAEYAFRKTTPRIIGDGKSTVMELTCKKVNKDNNPLPPSTCQLLLEEGLKVLGQGEVLELDWQHNLSHGASSDVLDLKSDVFLRHAAPLAEKAATALRLGFGSVDVAVVRNVATGVDEYTVLEVNSSTGVAYHLRQHPESSDVMGAMYSRAVARLFDLPYTPLTRS